VIQFDTGNGAAAGGDPVVYLKKFPGRVASVHVKPYSKTRPKALIGDDEHPWKEISISARPPPGGVVHHRIRKRCLSAAGERGEDARSNAALGEMLGKRFAGAYRGCETVVSPRADWFVARSNRAPWHLRKQADQG